MVETEKQESCPYCHFPYKTVFEANDFRFDYKGGINFYFKRTGGYLGWICNYCPECGRKL